MPVTNAGKNWLHTCVCTSVCSDSERSVSTGKGESVFKCAFEASSFARDTSSGINLDNVSLKVMVFEGGIESSTKTTQKKCKRCKDEPPERQLPKISHF